MADDNPPDRDKSLLERLNALKKSSVSFEISPKWKLEKRFRLATEKRNGRRIKAHPATGPKIPTIEKQITAPKS
ncbi:MAG: hypothetical protein Q9179_004388 [Wetmoreana sp. 5 TL-2023]